MTEPLLDDLEVGSPGSRSPERWPVAFSLATAWLRLTPIRRTHMKRPVKALQLVMVVRDGLWVFVTGWVRVFGHGNLKPWH
ncbi:MAG TPA: hypothetical protein VLW44_07705 [Streptosporangiaceae bacterium]|nr:hypothetical protein [Streptosporangiaceae bacterium]